VFYRGGVLFRDTACPLTGSRGRTPRACSRGRGARGSCLPVQRPLPQTASRKPRAGRAHTSVPPSFSSKISFMCKRTHFLLSTPRVQAAGLVDTDGGGMCVSSRPARRQRTCRAGHCCKFSGPRSVIECVLYRLPSQMHALYRM
jgi:hypothetical protein